MNAVEEVIWEPHVEFIADSPDDVRGPVIVKAKRGQRYVVREQVLADTQLSGQNRSHGLFQLLTMHCCYSSVAMIAMIARV